MTRQNVQGALIKVGSHVFDPSTAIFKIAPTQDETVVVITFPNSPLRIVAEDNAGLALQDWLGTHALDVEGEYNKRLQAFEDQLPK